MMNLPTTDELNGIDMKNISSLIPDDDSFKKYIDMSAGTDHYRLLRWISDQFNNVNLIDIGTFKGFSGASLSHNINNQVFSFDVQNHLVLNPIPKNLNIIIDDFKKYEDLLKSSPFIFYDTVHDGHHEDLFFTWLRSISYHGIVIFDDIYLNDQMKKFWQSID